jgi:hypothetical protein
LTRLRARGAVALVASLALLLSSCSLFRGATSAAVRILSPAPDARVTDPTLLARIRAQGPGFRARIDGKDVTGAFRASGGLWTATLQLGRDFDYGLNTLTAEVGKALTDSHHVAAVSFRAFRRDDQRLAVDQAEPLSAPLALRARSTGEVVTHRVIVNGRLVAEHFREHDDGRGVDVHLTARHGLRFGPNEVTVEVEHADGALSRHTRTVTVDPTRPLADAGGDRVVPSGRAVALDASGTLVPKGKGKPSYSWQLVAKPEGSNPTIERTGERVTLRLDRPGEYRVRLTAALGPAAATDDVVVTAALEGGELGVPIQTIGEDGRIYVGDPTKPGNYTCGQPGGFIQLLVIDAVSLVPSGPGCKSYEMNGSDMAQLACDILGEAFGRTCPNAASDDDLIILTGKGVPHGGTGPLGNPLSLEHQALNLVLSRIGATTEGRGLRKVEQDGTLTRGLPTLYDGRWSVIGMRGMPTGSAWQNYLLAQASIPGAYPFGRRGSLNGYLRQMLVSSPVKQFVQPEYVPIDTNAGDPNDPFTNVIKVGDQSYTATIGGGKALGVHLVVLDPSNLSHVWDWTYLLRDSEGQPYADGLRQFSHAWDQVRDDNRNPEELVGPRLVIAQTFGKTSNQGLKPVADTNSWVNDQLPSWGKTREGSFPQSPGVQAPYAEYFAWCGGGATKLEDEHANCTPFPNDPAAFGAAATPTYGIGLMAGMAARTAVANFGRDGVEAMTVVGPTHPYTDGDVTVWVGEQANRLVGTLRRTKQSVWSVAVGSPTDAGGFDPTEFWKLAVGPAKPWPMDPDTPSPDQVALAEAHGAVVRKLWPGSAGCIDDDPATKPCDVRDFYPDFLATEAWKADKADLDDLLAQPYPGMSDAGKNALAHLVPVLKDELDQLDKVKGLFETYERLISTPSAEEEILADALLIGSKVKAQVLKDLEQYQERLESERVRVNAELPIADALHLGGYLLEAFHIPVVPGVLGLVASSYSLFSGLLGNEDEKTIPRASFDPNVIETTVADAAAQLRKSYARQWETFERLLRVIVSSPDKLQTAYLRATARPQDGGWFIGVGSAEEGALVKAMAIGIQRELFRAILPAVYEQWVIAPTFTHANTGPMDTSTAGPRDYFCGGYPFRSQGGQGDIDDPANVPDEAIHWVRFEQSDPRWEASLKPATPGDTFTRNHATGRALKSKANPMPLQRLWANYTVALGPPRITGQYAYVATRFEAKFGPGGLALEFLSGASPPSGLMAKLFREPTVRSDATDPDGLALRKDEFFGMPTWTMPKLMCGVPFPDGAKRFER